MKRSNPQDVLKQRISKSLHKYRVHVKTIYDQRQSQIASMSKKLRKTGSFSDQVDFIWSCLKNTGFFVPDTPLVWTGVESMLSDMKKSSGKKGNIVVKSYVATPYQRKHLEATGKYFINPYILLENYNGQFTKIIGESKKSHNVAITTVGQVYHLNSRSHLEFYSPKKIIHSGTTFKLGHNNTIDFGVHDPTITGSHHYNSFRQTNKYGLWRVMGHSIKITHKGVFVDGHLLTAPSNTFVSNLQKKVNQIANALSILVYNLNDRRSALSYRLALNLIQNELNATGTHYHHYNGNSTLPQSRQDIMQNFILSAEKCANNRFLLPISYLYYILAYSGIFVHTGKHLVYDLSHTKSLATTTYSHAKAGTLFYVSYNHMSYAGILLEDYHGNDTKIIVSSSNNTKPHASALFEIRNIDISYYTFYQPTVNTKVPLPNQDDTVQIASNADLNDYNTSVNASEANSVGNSLSFPYWTQSSLGGFDNTPVIETGATQSSSSSTSNIQYNGPYSQGIYDESTAPGVTYNVALQNYYDLLVDNSLGSVAPSQSSSGGQLFSMANTYQSLSSENISLRNDKQQMSSRYNRLVSALKSNSVLPKDF